jgi:hypothetical protein
LVSPHPVSPVTQTPETQLQILGSLRKNDPGHPAPGETPPAPVQEHSSIGGSKSRPAPGPRPPAPGPYPLFDNPSPPSV